MIKNILLFIIAAWLLSSCNPIKRAQQVARNHPEAFADVCADLYPVKEEVVTIVTDTLRQVDTVETQLPPVEIEVPCPESPKPTIVKAKCPPCVDKVVTEVRTVTVTKETKVRDTARETALTQERDAEAAKADRLAKTNRVLWWIVILAGIALIGWIYWRIKAGALNSVIGKIKT